MRRLAPLSILLLLLASVGCVVTRASGLPESLSRADFWQLSAGASEPDGYFRSPNLTSNEVQFQYVIPELIRNVKPGNVYLGVGPEQNFTYIAALKPSMAIIFDIRRGNLLLQLMYKAIFELASDRAEFVSLLFSRSRPPGLGPDRTVTDLMAAYGELTGSRVEFEKNSKAIRDRLRRVDGLPLSENDVNAIQQIYETFYTDGFRVRYSPTYDELMTATDEAGLHRSYLATESSFAFMKDLEQRNLVVPVVGDFGGPKAIRSVAAYLRAHNATVGAFYLSNVEQYLESKTVTFCRNVQSLPLDRSSTFIRSSSRGFGGYGFGYGRGFVSSLGNMLNETRVCQDNPVTSR